MGQLQAHRSSAAVSGTVPLYLALLDQVNLATASVLMFPCALLLMTHPFRSSSDQQNRHCPTAAQEKSHASHQGTGMAHSFHSWEEVRLSCDHQDMAAQALDIASDSWAAFAEVVGIADLGWMFGMRPSVFCLFAEVRRWSASLYRRQDGFGSLQHSS